MSRLNYSWTDPVVCHYGYDLTKSWFVYFDFTDDLTKRKKRFQFRGEINKFSNKEERIKEANGLKRFWKLELENGWNPFMKDRVKKLPIHYTIFEGLDAVLKVHLPTLQKRTKETYHYVVRLFKEWLTKEGMDNISLAEFTKQDAQVYLDTLITERGYSGRTHNDHLIILATLFNVMLAKEWIIKNPFKKIDRRPAQIGRNIAFTDSEKEELRELLMKKDERLFYFTQIMYFTFIRRTELARLRVGDFDLVNKTIIIPSNISKNGEQESVVIPVGLEPILRRMRLDHYPSGYYVFGRHLFTSDVIYSNVNHISTRHNKFVKQLEIHSSKTLYSWKHSGVCAAYYATGKDVYALMRQLRHKSLETTMVYLKSLGLIQNDVFRNAMIA